MTQEQVNDVVLPPDISNKLCELVGQFEVTKEQALVLVFGFELFGIKQAMERIEKDAIDVGDGKSLTDFILASSALHVFAKSITGAFPAGVPQKAEVYNLVKHSMGEAKKTRQELQKDKTLN